MILQENKMNEEKKKYFKPEMTVVDMDWQADLLCDSCEETVGYELED